MILVYDVQGNMSNEQAIEFAKGLLKVWIVKSLILQDLFD